VKRVLVTGGAGFIGSNLIKQLLTDCPNVFIVSLDNYLTGKEENHLSHKNVTYLKGDTCDIEEIFIDLKEKKYFDTVFHFGEYSRIVKSFDDVNYVMKTNLHGTSRVLEMCRKWKSKLIYSASSSKFGNNGEDENLSPYSWAKSKIVELIKNYNKWYGLQYEICYFFNVYGPNQITEGDYATVIGIFDRQQKNGEHLTVVSPGTQSRDFTHVYDVVAGVIKTVGINLNREWMLRSGVNYKIIDVAKMFCDKIKMIPERRGERFTSEEFYSDTESTLSWSPNINLNDWVIKNK